MNTPPNVPKVKPGDPISAKYLNSITHAVRTQRLIVSTGGGIELQVKPGVGTFIRAVRDKKYVAQSAGSIAGFTLSGGIPQLTGGTCRVWSFDGTELHDTELDVTAYNFSPSAVAMDAWVWIELNADGYWFVTAEGCPGS